MGIVKSKGSFHDFCFSIGPFLCLVSHLVGPFPVIYYFYTYVIRTFNAKIVITYYFI